MFLKPLVHFCQHLAPILAKRRKLRIPLLFEGRTDTKDAILAFLERNELLAHPRTAPAVLRVALPVVGYLPLEEIGG